MMLIPGKLITLYRHPSKSTLRECYKDSTTNLKHHVELCDVTKNSSTKAMATYANGSTYSAAHLQFLLSMWCACQNCPFLIVEDEELVEICKMLYAPVDIPSWVTVSHNVKDIFVLCKVNVVHILKVHHYPFFLPQLSDGTTGILGQNTCCG